MPKRPAPRSRKKPPQQSRSRASVSAILDGMVRVLDQEGVDAATTTRIAEVAGVSIGTLYQYFGNRDDILCALQDRELDRATEMMQRVLADKAHASGREVARSVIESLLELYAVSPALHRLLVLEGLRVGPAERVKAFDLRLVDTLRGFLSLAKVSIRRKRVDAAAFVAFHSVRACMLARLLEAPPGLDDAALIEELTELVVRYLVDEAEPNPVADEARPRQVVAGEASGQREHRGHLAQHPAASTQHSAASTLKEPRASLSV